MTQGAMQLTLGLLSVAGLLLLSRGGARIQVAGWTLTLASQPFWVASTFLAGQWGMFAVSVLWTLIAIDALVRAIRRAGRRGRLLQEALDRSVAERHRHDPVIRQHLARGRAR